MVHQTDVEVLENIRLACDTFRIRLHCPSMAKSIRPGQFVMIRLPDRSDPLLARPFALYDIILDRESPFALEVVYLIVGKMTHLLSRSKPGEKVDIWGPLGNGFPEVNANHVGLVAGGIGQTPFLAEIRHLLGTRGYGGHPPRAQAKRVSVYYGVRSRDLLAGVEDMQGAGASVFLATDDGTLGFRGNVVELLSQGPLPDHLIGCGPEPMLKALARDAGKHRIPCHLSLETPMACGIGICFSCVTKVQAGDGWDYRRVCVDGPVFDAATLIWE